MGINPSIPLAGQLPQIEGPVDLQKGALSVQYLINAAQLQKQQQAANAINQQQQQLALQEQQQMFKDQQAFNKAYSDAGGDWDKAISNATSGGVSATYLLKAQAARTDQLTKLATMNKEQLANESAKAEQLGKDASSLLAIDDPQERQQAYIAIRNAHLLSGAYKPNELPATVPSDQELESYKAHSKAAMDMAKEAADLQEKNAKIPGEQAEAQQKRMATAAMQMSNAQNQIAWTAKRNWVAKTDPEIAAQIPENYSPEAEEQVRQMGITPDKLFAGPAADKIQMADFIAHPPKGYKGTPTEFLRYSKSIAPNITAVIAAGGGPAGPMGNANDPVTQASIDLVGQNKAKLGEVLTPRVPLAARRAFIKNLTDQYPEYDTKNYDVEKGVEKAFTSGQYSQQLNSINRAREHMGTFLDLAKNINNTDVQVVNRIKNAWITQFGGSAPTNLNIAKQAFASEVGKSFAGANVALADRQELDHQINNASSWEQLRDAAATADNLLAGAQKALKRTYESGMQGKPNFGEEGGGGGEKKATHRFNPVTGKIEPI